MSTTTITDSKDSVYQTDALIAADIDAYLVRHQHKSLLRFITCGSVDDGKSTLIGRLLYDSKMIFEDQLAALEADSKKVGTQGQEIDFALLVDGLAAEREQGITIDVAYRFFSTEKRKFIVADTPGHEQYTRNMATGASNADLAVILIDARKGVLTQTRRHSHIVALLGIRRRLKLGKWLGGFNGWRLVHIGIGLAATLVLVWHTGFRLGENLNLVLMASFIVTYRVSEIKNGDDFASF